MLTETEKLFSADSHNREEKLGKTYNSVWWKKSTILLYLQQYWWMRARTCFTLPGPISGSNRVQPRMIGGNLGKMMATDRAWCKLRFCVCHHYTGGDNKKLHGSSIYPGWIYPTNELLGISKLRLKSTKESNDWPKEAEVAWGQGKALTRHTHLPFLCQLVQCFLTVELAHTAVLVSKETCAVVRL